MMQLLNPVLKGVLTVAGVRRRRHNQQLPMYEAANIGQFIHFLRAIKANKVTGEYIVGTIKTIYLEPVHPFATQNAPGIFQHNQDDVHWNKNYGAEFTARTDRGTAAFREEYHPNTIWAEHPQWSPLELKLFATVNERLSQIKSAIPDITTELKTNKGATFTPEAYEERLAQIDNLGVHPF